jgi:hypothetical protein
LCSHRTCVVAHVRSHQPLNRSRVSQISCELCCNRAGGVFEAATHTRTDLIPLLINLLISPTRRVVVSLCR